MAFQAGDLQATLTLKDFMTRELKKTQGVVTKFASRSRSAFRRVSGAVVSLKGALGALAIGAFARSTIQAFTVQEKAIAGMEQVMRSMGRYTPEASKRLQDFASELQGIGIAGDEAIIEGTKFLLTYRQITDDLLPDTIRAMADLAALTGQDMVAAANIMGKAAMGMTGMLARYGITISDAAKKSKDFKMILKDITDQVGGQNEALRRTGFGGLKAFSNAWGDLKEQVGEVLVEGLLPIVKELSAQMKTWEIATKENKNVSLEVFESIALGVGRVVDGIHAMQLGLLHFKKAALEARVALEEGEEVGWVKTVNEGVRSIVPGLEAVHDKYDEIKGEIFGKKEIPEQVNFTRQAIQDLEIDIAKMKLKVSKYDDIRTFFQKLRDDAAKQQELKDLLTDFIRLNEALAGMKTTAAPGLDAVLIGLDRIDKHVTRLGGNIGAFARIYEEYQANLARAMRKAEEDTKKVNKATNDYTGTVEELKGFWQDVEKAIKDSKKATDEFGDRQRDFQSEWDLWYGKRKKDTRELTELEMGLKDAFLDAASIIESAFIRALDESLDKGVQWRQLAQDILGDFAKMAISMAFRFGVSAATSAIFGAAKGGVFNGLGERTPVRTYARGGVMGSQPEVAIMNEGRQREAVVPLPDNRSIPVKILDGGGRGDVHFHFDVLDGQNAMSVLERHADGISAIVNRKNQENPQRF